MNRRTMIAFGFLALLLMSPLRAAAGGTGSGPGVSANPQASPEQQLADRFAPIAYLRQQEQNCDRKGEGFMPAPMEVVLGNPEVALKQRTSDSSTTDTIVMMGPTAQDLAGLDDTYYLDLPGNPRHPGCTYEQHYKRYAAEMGVEPTTYAHIVINEEEGVLVLQYWFWYYFNDWNNTHESDWEMMQLVFETTSVEEALASEPAWVGYAQHGGGETADWGDDKLNRDGDRVHVFPGAGSHGTYYNQDTYIGWGENGTGFGCDNTTAPSIATPLTAVLIPDEIDPNGPFAWLLYEGRWGEYQAWEFNGPTGPNLKTAWEDPVTGMENWRDSSLSAPGSNNPSGPSATDLFCNLSEAGSRLLMEVGTRPWLLVTIVIGILGGIIALFIIKRQELREAFSMWARHLRVFVLIGLFTIPIGIIFNGFQLLVSEVPPMEWVIKWFNDTAGGRLTAVAVVGAFQQAAMVLLIAPPVIQAVRDIRNGVKPGVRRSFEQSYRHIVPIFIALVIYSVTVSLMLLIVFAIPIAIWLGVRWQFYNQVSIVEDIHSGPASIVKSQRAVSGRWWQAFSDTIIFQVLAVIPGPFVGALLMLAGKASVEFANAFSSIVYALTVPISVIGLTLAYMRYRDRMLTARAPAPAAPPPVETPAPETGPVTA